MQRTHSVHEARRVESIHHQSKLTVQAAIGKCCALLLIDCAILHFAPAVDEEESAGGAYQPEDVLNGNPVLRVEYDRGPSC